MSSLLQNVLHDKTSNLNSFWHQMPICLHLFDSLGKFSLSDFLLHLTIMHISAWWETLHGILSIVLYKCEILWTKQVMSHQLTTFQELRSEALKSRYRRENVAILGIA